jgi:DegV family protein with EDD domain
MNVRIVTDSTARFLSSAVQELGITVVPLHIKIGDREYLDGIDLNEQEFFQILRKRGKKPSVLPPTVEDFARVYEELHRTTGEIISIHLPEEFSGAVRNARQAADMLLGQCKIEVIDSETISLGLGILVEAAARATADGRSIDQVVRFVRGLIPQIYVVFFSENLNYLEHASGIGQAQAFLGTMLGVKPLFTLEAGEIVPIEKVRTREHAIEKLIEFVTEFDGIKQIAIIKNAPNLTQETAYITEQLQVAFPGLEVAVMAYGPVLASYIGPEALGLVVYEDPDFEV